jgi:hypothetical protein
MSGGRPACVGAALAQTELAVQPTTRNKVATSQEILRDACVTWMIRYFGDTLRYFGCDIGVAANPVGRVDCGPQWSGYFGTDIYRK